MIHFMGSLLRCSHRKQTSFRCMSRPFNFYVKNRESAVCCADYAKRRTESEKTRKTHNTQQQLKLFGAHSCSRDGKMNNCAFAAPAKKNPLREKVKKLTFQKTPDSSSTQQKKIALWAWAVYFRCCGCVLSSIRWKIRCEQRIYVVSTSTQKKDSTEFDY